MSEKPLHWSGSEHEDVLSDEIARAGGYAAWRAMQQEEDEWDGIEMSGKLADRSAPISPYIRREAERLHIPTPKPSEYLMDNLRMFDAIPFPPPPRPSVWQRIVGWIWRNG